MQKVPKVGSSDEQFICPLIGSGSCGQSTATELKKDNVFRMIQFPQANLFFKTQ